MTTIECSYCDHDPCCSLCGGLGERLVDTKKLGDVIRAELLESLSMGENLVDVWNQCSRLETSTFTAVLEALTGLDFTDLVKAADEQESEGESE